MKAVRVRYTVKPEYAEENKANIRKVMEALRADPIEGMRYSTFVLDDGQTFIHFNMATDQATLAKLQDVPEFQAFRQALKASGPVSPPAAENLNLVGAGYDVV